MTELPFYHSLTSWLVFLLLLGLAANRCWQARERENRYTFGIRVGSTLAAPVLLLFMATHLHTLWQAKAYVQSQGEEAGALSAVINPFGISMTLEFLVMSRQLQAASSLGMSRFVDDYLVWADDHDDLAPSPELYSNMLRAESMQIEDLEASASANMASHLFPSAQNIQAILEGSPQEAGE